MMLFVYILAVIAMGLGAIYLIWLGQRQAQEEAVARRLASVGVQALDFPKKDWLTLQLERAGITLQPTQRRILGLALGLLLLLAALQFGVAVAALLAFALVAFAYTAVGTLYQRLMNRIVSQLPRLLDQVVRLMRTGKTLADSFFIATREADEPLKTVMLKLQRNIQ
ncbi:MAG: hypothetical protein VW625_10525, partial [Perlucidibaca sp.]